jgi:hypothetical protein
MMFSDICSDEVFKKKNVLYEFGIQILLIVIRKTMSQMHAVPTNPKAFGIQDHLIATSFHLKSHGYQPEVRVREMFVDDDLSKENRPARFATVNPIEKAALARPTDGLSGKELEFLANYISGTGFYVESLEEYLGETLGDFWQAREHAYHIITGLLLHRIRIAGMSPAEQSTYERPQ